MSTFGAAITPVYYMNRIIGQAPYSRNNNVYRPNRWAAIYTVLLMFSYWITFGTAVQRSIEDTDGDLSIKTSTTYLQISIGCATQTVCWLCAIFQQNLITNCYNLMILVDEKLKKIAPDAKYQVIYKNNYFIDNHYYYSISKI